MICCFCVFASAEGTPTNVNLTSSFDDSGQYLQITISTSNAVAGIMGTFTYDDTTVKLIPANTVFCTSDNTVDNSLKCSENTVDIVLVGDVVDGTTNWITFKFEVLQTANVDFILSNVSACDVDEQDVYTTINNKTINVSVEALSTLGAQVCGETTNNIRFGSKLVREATDTGEYIVVDGNTYKAKSCGYLVALTSKLASGEQMVAVDSTNTSVKNKQSTKCYLRQDTYFVYTMVITGITDTYKDTQISARPYVIYDVGGVDYYSYGNQVSKSVNEVEEVYYK